jgi:hypothetical protein
MSRVMPIDEMGVLNVAFLIENLSKDAGELQYLRELVQNAFEAIQRAKRASGEIVIDYEVIEGVRKLRITDNGIGMTADEVRENINTLSASGGEQAFDKNFGIGAKITAAVKNPNGVMYKAWKNGRGSLTILGRQDGCYGRLPWPNPLPDKEGEVVYSLPLPESEKSDLIEDSGVSVVLLGTAPDHDTFAPPEGFQPGTQWIAAYLERRYFTIPSSVTVRIKRSNPIQDAERGSREIFDSLRGHKHQLDTYSDAKGVCKLPTVDAAVHWWLLTEKIQEGGKHWNNRGHVAALYQSELYEVRSGPARFSALKDFGVYAGHSRIVLYVEPFSVVGANSQRSALVLRNGESLDYAAIGEAFADKMPDELVAFMSGQVTSENTDHRKAIAKAIQEVEAALDQARYRRVEKGGRLDSYEPDTGGRALHGEQQRGGRRETPGRSTSATGRAGLEYLRRAREELERQRGERVDRTDPTPQFSWDEDGSQSQPGRAANYVRNGHRVVVNGQCPFYLEMLEWAVIEGKSRVSEIEDAALRDMCKEEVRRWFEQALAEAVVTLRPMEFSANWGPTPALNALSDEALTAAVVSHRWHMMSAIKRGLAGRLGRVRDGSQLTPA